METTLGLVERIRREWEERPSTLAGVLRELPAADVAEAINQMTLAEAGGLLAMLPTDLAIRICDQATLRRRPAVFEQIPPDRAARILEGMAADERTATVQGMSPRERGKLLPLIAAPILAETEKLLQYPPRTAGGIMTTEFVQLDPGMTVREALKTIRSVAREKESIYACYILEPTTRKLLGAVSLRDLVMSDLDDKIAAIMRTKPATVHVADSQQSVAEKIGKYNLLAAPVLDDDGAVVGFVTVDDIIDVIVEEHAEDVLRLGAVEPGAVDQPYVSTPMPTLIRVRAMWLVILFLGEMLTATAMAFFEEEIAKAVVLALFVPLIISSGGNSGSQAASLIIRALALKEISLTDWWMVVRRELFSGFVLGSILGSIGFLRIAVWTLFSNIYGEHWFLVGITVGLSLVGIVMWGTLSGALLPIILKRLGFDPATSSAPFVATLVDVTGLVIYFSVAAVVLHGTLL